MMCSFQTHIAKPVEPPELNRLCNIKEVGRRAYNSPDSSKIIREQVPAPARRTSGLV
jgi:hypothetical protein